MFSGVLVESRGCEDRFVISINNIRMVKYNIIPLLLPCKMNPHYQVHQVVFSQMYALNWFIFKSVKEDMQHFKTLESLLSLECNI